MRQRSMQSWGPYRTSVTLPIYLQTENLKGAVRAFAFCMLSCKHQSRFRLRRNAIIRFPSNHPQFSLRPSPSSTPNPSYLSPHLHTHRFNPVSENYSALCAAPVLWVDQNLLKRMVPDIRFASVSAHAPDLLRCLTNKSNLPCIRKRAPNSLATVISRNPNLSSVLSTVQSFLSTSHLSQSSIDSITGHLKIVRPQSPHESQTRNLVAFIVLLAAQNHFSIGTRRQPWPLRHSSRSLEPANSFVSVVRY
ncbi:uncharacterized protein BDR25DRAFT_351814 [Lindgomyces ingoldianus]|uniref:Uncharacterized protein n=1 Tax=Lindgomyces ingoldianus TaxID=673940 RepID=A0ACB6R598_9PLEO|nr:uncharacterized protein BDR25DRAFT_351814 [Lindgomyces ingoldianus]KAF2474255.1 hypothetical protein BDR25DRAFT_351814 [Lindgomyces ingoldianus]